ncbi:MAG: TVP38/TMEM64 family protein [Clostridium sp.]|uniref:TVP38/TMEM64 family protein n=1 Tax=Clostridium TaxID=1485 RepID=UPI0021527ED8|nr:TVP38/TMEM64 family protein [Clostridium sp. LY3-2]MCR6514714.1 TVP38/TMEM64 family protein [Clostridium sp. LY3-2]
MEKKKITTANKVKFIILISIIVIAVLFIGDHYKFIESLNVDEICTFIKERSGYAAAIYLLSYVIKPFLFVVPTNVMAIVSGIVFGPVKGFILTMIGFFITGTIAFFVSRYLGRNFVEGFLGNKFMKLDDNIEKNGFKILFLLRLPPILPYDPLSYACGLTKIKYKDFILASLLGVLPETICYSIIGKNISNPLSPQFIIPMLFLLCGVIFSKKIMDKRKK